MKRLITRMNGAAAVATVLAMSFAASAPALADTTLRFAHYASTNDVPHMAAVKFKELVETKTGGSVRISLHPAYELGNDPAMLEGVRLGTIDLTLVGNPFFTSFAPELNVLDLPFLFESKEHAYEVLDGPIGRGLLDGLEKNNLKGLAFWEVGFRHVTNSKRPIRETADLAGLKIRTTPNPAHVMAFKMLGANPTPMPFNEVYSALQTGTVDGQENPVVLIHKVRLYEVQKHLSLTSHAYTAAPLVANKGAFERLSADEQKALIEAALEAAAYERQVYSDLEASSLAEMKAAGLQVVSDPNVKAFRDTVADATRQAYVEKFGDETVTAIVNAR